MSNRVVVSIEVRLQNTAVQVVEDLKLYTTSCSPQPSHLKDQSLMQLAGKDEEHNLSKQKNLILQPLEMIHHALPILWL